MTKHSTRSWRILAGQPEAALVSQELPPASQESPPASQESPPAVSAPYGKKGQVLALLANHVKVKLLEGPAKDEEHKYLYKDFTATTLLPPLPPPLKPPAGEVATEPAAAAAVNQAPSLPVTESQAEVDAFMEVFD